MSALCVRYCQFNHQLHLLKLLTHPSLLRNGHAQKLFQLITPTFYPQTRTWYLEVEQENLSAISFYQNQGFEIIHKKNNYYSGGKGVFFMLLTL